MGRWPRGRCRCLRWWLHLARGDPASQLRSNKPHGEWQGFPRVYCSPRVWGCSLLPAQPPPTRGGQTQRAVPAPGWCWCGLAQWEPGPPRPWRAAAFHNPPLCVLMLTPGPLPQFPQRSSPLSHLGWELFLEPFPATWRWGVWGGGALWPALAIISEAQAHDSLAPSTQLRPLSRSRARVS